MNLIYFHYFIGGSKDGACEKANLPIDEAVIISENSTERYTAENIVQISEGAYKQTLKLAGYE